MTSDSLFKDLLIKKINFGVRYETNFGVRYETDDSIRQIASKLRNAKISLENTGKYIYYAGYKDEGWNTYCTFLTITTNFDDVQYLESKRDMLTQVAKSIYNSSDNHVLVDTHIFPSLEENISVDFTVLNNVDSVFKAISDAEESMTNGQYENAIDRVHTAIHGYFRSILEQNGIQFQQDEKINKLYKQIQFLIENEIEPAEVASLVKTTVRSASGIISTLNDVRNRHSLSHPSASIIGKNEAKLVISMANAIVEYIGNYLNEN